ncbi:Stearoyl-CoA desaturase 5 [Araneus ventricosus]|uniref:Stearoyl-CoA desaturase 5 n=2 Tax=Araneus ventricosus TaxID=182803 RepID=A0A4Y2V4F4_ARAVE|nr:Stearoyl-CoA desaturase 5 [Araneus ventricosus]
MSQNDIYEWCRDHRVHHKFTETDADPHNIKRGFFFAHMGWLMCKKHPDVIKKGKTVFLEDLWADPIVRFQRRDATVNGKKGFYTPDGFFVEDRETPPSETNYRFPGQFRNHDSRKGNNNRHQTQPEPENPRVNRTDVGSKDRQPMPPRAELALSQSEFSAGNHAIKSQILSQEQEKAGVQESLLNTTVDETS